jgi:hypothetical protein
MTIETAETTAVAVPPVRRLVAWVRAGGWRPLAMGAFGALAGGGYAHFRGCEGGSCVLLSSVRSATVAGALVGLVVGWRAPEKRT